MNISSRASLLNGLIDLKKKLYIYIYYYFLNIQINVLQIASYKLTNWLVQCTKYIVLFRPTGAFKKNPVLATINPLLKDLLF